MHLQIYLFPIKANTSTLPVFIIGAANALPHPKVYYTPFGKQLEKLLTKGVINKTPFRWLNIAVFSH